jgi:hypothetical protein
MKRNARTHGDRQRTSMCSCGDRGNPPESGQARACNSGGPLHATLDFSTHHPRSAGESRGMQAQALPVCRESLVVCAMCCRVEGLQPECPVVLQDCFSFIL